MAEAAAGAAGVAAAAGLPPALAAWPARWWLNPAAQAASVGGPPPLISVVVPFFKFDASALARRLSELGAAQAAELELIFADDGSPDPAGGQALQAALQTSPVPARVISFVLNQGRSIIRNRLSEAARGDYLLYLDADMMPDEPDYLQRYLGLARQGAADIVYGGRSAKHCVGLAPELELHRRFTELREAVPAARRTEAPAYHFYSCNFIARREVLVAVPLDESFKGWGWEDIEWAARAAERYSLLHIDNPASHLGLLTVTQILAKYDESVGNFQRMLTLRPEMVKPTGLFRTAQWLARWRLGALVRGLARWAACSSWMPERVRLASLSIYKAALYSAVL